MYVFPSAPKQGLLSSLANIRRKNRAIDGERRDRWREDKQMKRLVHEKVGR